MSRSVHVSTALSVSKLTTATSVVYMMTVSGSRTRAANTKISTPFWVRKIHSHEQDIDLGDLTIKALFCLFCLI